jgi:hypothetical protein
LSRTVLNMRLSPDMFNLARQVRAAIDHAANAAGRLSGKELLKFANDETTITQLKDRIAKTTDYLKSTKPSEIDGTEAKEISITFPSGQVTSLAAILPDGRCVLCQFAGLEGLVKHTTNDETAGNASCRTS